MVEVTREFQVSADPEKVITYLREFSHAQEWDPGTIQCTRRGSGPVDVGAEWDNVSKFMGNETELVYELTTSAPDRVCFTGKNKTVTTLDDISVRAGDAPGAAHISYRATVELSGLAKLGTPVIKAAFEKLANDTVQSMTSVLQEPRFQ